MTTAELKEIPQELRHYTCQQCGMGHPDANLFTMIVAFKIGFVVCKTCLSGGRGGWPFACREGEEPMRTRFIVALVEAQKRAVHQSTRGIMIPETLRVIEEQAEVDMAAIEREAAAKALTEAADAFEGAEINLAVFNDQADSARWSYSNYAHRNLVASLRARAAAYRREAIE